MIFIYCWCYLFCTKIRRNLIMRLENGELKMLGKFRMYAKLTKTPSTIICDEIGITRITFGTIMKDERYIPSKKVRDKIGFFMDHKLTEMQQLINS